MDSLSTDTGDRVLRAVVVRRARSEPGAIPDERRNRTHTTI